MKKPFLLFDFDGTVANSIDKLFELINGLAPRYGYAPISSERFAELRDLPLAKACRELKVPLYKIGKVVPVILSEYRKIVPDLEPCPGIVAALAELKILGCEMALISSNHTENVQAFLDHHRISSFAWVEGTGGILHKHGSINAQIKHHGLSRERVFYIGDEARDIRAARKSWVRVISVAWGLHSPGYLSKHKPDHLALTPSEIVKIFNDML